MQTTTATPTKLRNGSWGARVKGTVRQGDTITITTRAGKSWDAEVVKVVWSGDGVSICATRSLDRPAHRTSRPSRSCRRCGCTERGCGATGMCRGPSFDPCFDCV